MRTVTVQELTREGFRLFGTYQNMLDAGAYRLGEEGTNEFSPDMLTLDLHDGIASFSIARVSPCPMVVENMEYHLHTCEGILPLDGDCVIYAGRSSWQPDPGSIAAFRVPRGTMVRLNQGVLHGRQFAMGEAPVHVLIVLPVRTYGNDCVFTMLEEKDRISLKLPGTL